MMQQINEESSDEAPQLSNLLNDESDECVIAVKEELERSSSDDDAPLQTHSTNGEQSSETSTWRTNLPKQESGVCKNGVGVTSFQKAWSLFMNDEIIDEIVAMTNKLIEKKAVKYNRLRDCKPTDAVELRALFGLLYIAGSMQIAHKNVEDLWATDGTGSTIFHTTMPLKRNSILMNCLECDDDVEATAFEQDAQIRSLLEKFTANCWLTYSVGQDVVIDEMVLDIREPSHNKKTDSTYLCNASEFCVEKSHNMEDKLYLLVDVKTSYIMNVEPCKCEQPNDWRELTNAPPDVVSRLITPISGTGRHLTIVNFYNTLPLVQDLADTHKLSVVGPADMTDLPTVYTDVSRPEYSTHFKLYDKATLVSYIPTVNVIVVLLASHHQTEIDECTKQRRQPSIVTHYIRTKNVVRQLDENLKKFSSYSMQRLRLSVPRQSQTFLFRLLDMAANNAMVVLRANGVQFKNRQMFLRALGVELTKQNVERRTANACIGKNLKRKMLDLLQAGPEEACDELCTSSVRTRQPCKICPCKTRRLSKTQCHNCRKHICREHTVFICKRCFHHKDYRTSQCDNTLG